MTHSQLLISGIITLLIRRPKCYFYFSIVSYFALSTSRTSQDQAQLQDIDRRLVFRCLPLVLELFIAPLHPPTIMAIILHLVLNNLSNYLTHFEQG